MGLDGSDQHSDQRTAEAEHQRDHRIQSAQHHWHQTDGQGSVGGGMGADAAPADQLQHLQAHGAAPAHEAGVGRAHDDHPHQQAYQSHNLAHHMAQQQQQQPGVQQRRDAAMQHAGLPALGPQAGAAAQQPAEDPATLHPLLERINHLEHYKSHLELQNSHMHQQLQVLSGFLNVVSSTVRTTETLLYPAVAGIAQELTAALAPAQASSSGGGMDGSGPSGHGNGSAAAAAQALQPGAGYGAAGLPLAPGSSLPPQPPLAGLPHVGSTPLGHPDMQRRPPSSSGGGYADDALFGRKRARMDGGASGNHDALVALSGGGGAPGAPLPYLSGSVGGPPPPLVLAGQMPPPPLSTSGVVLRLTKIRGKTAVHAADVSLYRLELHRSGLFEKYLYVPNDAIPLYGVAEWTQREAIPQEVLKMVENCLTTKAVPSEQYADEMKAMKAEMLPACPHLTRWGLGSNKVRLVTHSGMQDLISRLHRALHKHGTLALPKQLDADLSWVADHGAPQVPVHQWTAPVYSRRAGNPDENTAAVATNCNAATAAAAPAKLEAAEVARLMGRSTEDGSGVQLPGPPGDQGEARFHLGASGAAPGAPDAAQYAGLGTAAAGLPQLPGMQLHSSYPGTAADAAAAAAGGGCDASGDAPGTASRASPLGGSSNNSQQTGGPTSSALPTPTNCNGHPPAVSGLLDGGPAGGGGGSAAPVGNEHDSALADAAAGLQALSQQAPPPSGGDAAPAQQQQQGSQPQQPQQQHEHDSQAAQQQQQQLVTAAADHRLSNGEQQQQQHMPHLHPQAQQHSAADAHSAAAAQLAHGIAAAALNAAIPPPPQPPGHYPTLLHGAHAAHPHQQPAGYPHPTGHPHQQQPHPGAGGAALHTYLQPYTDAAAAAAAHGYSHYGHYGHSPGYQLPHPHGSYSHPLYMHPHIPGGAYAPHQPLLPHSAPHHGQLLHPHLHLAPNFEEVAAGAGGPASFSHHSSMSHVYGGASAVSAGHWGPALQSSAAGGGHDAAAAQQLRQ